MEITAVQPTEIYLSTQPNPIPQLKIPISISSCPMVLALLLIARPHLLHYYHITEMYVYIHVYVV